MKEEMCSSQQGSKRKASKKELPRRCWSGDEDRVLLACMKELVVQGWKSDNGFRGGFLNRLEEAMRKHFPGTDIKGQPHINSKITAWKKTYGTIMSILNRSGIGFNLKGDLKIDCDDAQWEEATRAEPTAKNWRNKSWPLLEGWKEVFGKDRAGGGGAEDVMESVNELIHENENRSAGQQQNEDSYVNLEDEIPTPAVEDTASQQSTYAAAKASKNLKKRKMEDSIHALVDLVGEIRKDSRARFEVMSDNLASQAAAGKVNKDLYPLLQKIPNLSEFDIFYVGEKLLQMPERFHFFMGLPDEARTAYVHRLMKNAK